MRQLTVQCLATALVVFAFGNTLTAPAQAGAIRTGFDSNSLGAIDDRPSAQASLGFSIKFFGTTYSDIFVNNNGNATFGSAFTTYTPESLDSLNRAILAPYFADVDTRRGPNVTYGQGSVDGHQAFAVNWIGVGYYRRHIDTPNSFQLVIIERSDRGVGEFDVEFNYDQILWETGDASGGSGGQGG
jgi:hypothetical protein